MGVELHAESLDLTQGIPAGLRVLFTSLRGVWGVRYVHVSMAGKMQGDTFLGRHSLMLGTSRYELRKAPFDPYQLER